jgi:hypothetical protein
MRLLLILLCATFLSAQTKSVAVERKNTGAVFGGMGVHMVSAPGIVEYINSTATSAQRVNDFGAAVDFFGGIEFPVSDEWGVKLEHSYLFKSYTYDGKLSGTYDLYFETQSPSVIIQRIIAGKGYFVKFGAGGGYHFGTVIQKISTFGTTSEYTANGIGVKGEIVGQTAFGEDLFGYIGGSIGYEFIGDLKDEKGNNLTASSSSKAVTLNYFHVGIRFGLNYYF